MYYTKNINLGMELKMHIKILAQQRAQWRGDTDIFKGNFQTIYGPYPSPGFSNKSSSSLMRLIIIILCSERLWEYIRLQPGVKERQNRGRKIQS